MSETKAKPKTVKGWLARDRKPENVPEGYLFYVGGKVPEMHHTGEFLMSDDSVVSWVCSRVARRILGGDVLRRAQYQAIEYRPLSTKGGLFSVHLVGKPKEAKQ